MDSDHLRYLAKNDPAFTVGQIVSALSLLTGEYGTLPVLVAVKNWVRFVERERRVDARRRDDGATVEPK